MLIIIVILLLGIFISYNPKEVPDNYVVRVIDGDTFELADGNIVRMICIDAPENDQESTDYLKILILDKEVRLEKDVDDKDRYGRLLRYVYVDNLFFNKVMVEESYAEVFRY